MLSHASRNFLVISDYVIKFKMLQAQPCIAEGFESGYDPEFVRFLKMARRSAGEVQSELYLALDADFITQEELKIAYDLAIDVKKLINGMISYLSKN